MRQCGDGSDETKKSAGPGMGNGKQYNKDDGVTDSSDTTATRVAKTSDRGFTSPVRVGVLLILIVDAALVMAVFRRKRAE